MPATQRRRCICRNTCGQCNVHCQGTVMVAGCLLCPWQHSTTLQHSTAQHSTAQHSTARHSSLSNGSVQVVGQTSTSVTCQAVHQPVLVSSCGMVPFAYGFTTLLWLWIQQRHAELYRLPTCFVASYSCKKVSAVASFGGKTKQFCMFCIPAKGQS